MRIVCISDTHDMAPLTEKVVPWGDVLIHAGDLTIQGKFLEIQRVGLELAALPHKHKLVIAGNHDWLFQKDNGLARLALGDGTNGIKYLQDETALIPVEVKKENSLGTQYTREVLEFWGSPWTPRFYDWAFQLEDRRPETERPFLLGGSGPRTSQEHWKNIPGPVDVLVTHGPPKGILDLVHHGLHVGDAHLLAAVDRIRPKIHVFGHIHTSPGVVEQDGTVFVNACLCDNSYRMIHPPVVLDYEEDGKVTIVSR